MKNIDEDKRKKRNEVLKLSIVLFFGSLIIIFILKDAPAPWKDPLGFIWYIITQPEPIGHSPAQWPFIIWLMIFSLPYIIWIFSAYEYFTGSYNKEKGSELYATVVIAWAVITIVVSLISIIIQDIAGSVSRIVSGG
jgi:hypothetical protein